VGIYAELKARKETLADLLARAIAVGASDLMAEKLSGNPAQDALREKPSQKEPVCQTTHNLRKTPFG
jgi:hypothetical protein